MLRYLVVLALCGLVPALAAHDAETKPVESQQQVEESAIPVAEKAEAPAESAPAKPSARITGIYSTLKSLGGDEEMIGMEVIIVRSREGFRAFVQTADGLPAAPALVPVSVDGATVVFTVPASTGEPLEFKGKATRQGLTGTLGDRQVTLPRRKSYWQ
ncbi:MAG TPA: hypothetical protein PLZ79_09425 [Burkholderiales bacterium]|nr:hypothetical protein [Burkholderiales bacterium]